MGITGELRELAHVFSNVWLDKDGSVIYTTGASAPSMESVNLEEYIKDIADRIDVEHEREMQRMWDEAETFDFAAFEATHIELPKDADGEYIHIGDVMVNLRDDLEPYLHHTFRVYSIQYRDYEQVCALTENGYPAILHRADECRHYHAPTVEKVLLEFAQECLTYATDVDDHEVVDAIEKYAKRLTLAGDAE